MVNKEDINPQIHWSNQFLIPTSHSGNLQQDFYANDYQEKQALMYKPSPQTTLLAHGYAENERDALSQNNFYFNQPQITPDTFLPESSKPVKKDEKEKQPHLDYSFLLQHNQHMEQASKGDEEVEEEEGEEGEPVIGDGARSYSSIGSTGSRRSQKLSKDDKRKRNTAASARFRIKKKMREKALQSTASEMTEKATHMEQRVHELEREIKWLKALIVEKDDGKLEQLISQKPSVSLAFPTPSSSLSRRKKIQETDEDEDY